MLLLETICIHHKTIQNLPFHQARFDQSRRRVLGVTHKIDLEQHIPLPHDAGRYKCRILYQKNIEKIEVLPYTMREIQSLKIVIANDFDYGFKYADRLGLSQLMLQKGQADDILIIKNGNITDTSYCNIVCWDGQDWWTPDTPLLRGTRREKYLQEGRIKARSITVEDLGYYKGVKLINAMMGLDDTKMIPIEQIEKADPQS